MHNADDKLAEEILHLIADLEMLRRDVIEEANVRLAPVERYFTDGKFSNSAYK